MERLSSPPHSIAPPLKKLSPLLLDQTQIDRYLKDGVLVVDNVLSESELIDCKNGLAESLQTRGIKSFDVNDEESAIAFQKLSSTNGSGGVLDIFHDDWKLKLATNPKLFAITQQLWKEAYDCGSLSKESLPNNERFRWHPYGGDVDFENKGYCYIDRVGYRLPTELAEEWGDRIHKRNSFPNSTKITSKKKRKKLSIQRSLTPHLDCCPDNLYENTNKWRPIQCFVSLTDNLEPNTGGFEAVLGGFHRSFDDWARNRNAKNDAEASEDGVITAAPCLGEYTHIRPNEDIEVMKRICHISVRAGSAVFWDNRIPHANAYRNNDASLARAVVYTSFLPDIELNRQYVKNQLKAWKTRQPIRDQWNHIPDEVLQNDQSGKNAYSNEDIFDDLGKRLMGIEPW